MVLVLGGLQVMAKCNPSMMCGLLVIACLMMLAGLTMMFGGLFVMLRRLFVMLVNFDLSHCVLPDIFWLQERAERTRTSTLRRSSFIN